MKNLKLFSLIAISLLFSATSSAFEPNNPFEDKVQELPSAQTQNQIHNMSEPGRPVTRQDPDGGGSAQKETPISGTTTSVIFLLISCSTAYLYAKNKKLKNIQK